MTSSRAKKISVKRQNDSIAGAPGSTPPNYTTKLIPEKIKERKL
jgi:hypothetical protein